ncbi:hypothetical protein [Streptomyces sp. NPDC002276]
MAVVEADDRDLAGYGDPGGGPGGFGEQRACGGGAVLLMGAVEGVAKSGDLLRRVALFEPSSYKPPQI